MNDINFARIPAALRERDQWVLWKYETRGDKPTKIPVRVDESPAKSNDPLTWATFESVRNAFDPDRHGGIGFVFEANDPFCGIDLDGCRDAQTGRVADWAREVILRLASYAEVSPSGTGVKIFVLGKSPFDRGRKREIPGLESICDKAPAVEIYDFGRYFAVTGWQLRGPAEPVEAADSLNWIAETYFPDEQASAGVPVDFRSEAAVVDRARKYLARIPAAISGQSGHNVTFHAACVLVLGFELPENDSVGLLLEWNDRCQPPWSVRELERKVREAAKQPGQRGYLRNTAVQNWGCVQVPNYREPRPPAQPQPIIPEAVTLVEASRNYLDLIRRGETNLLSTSVPDLDYALGGGLAFGELVIFAARPSHGKSAVALQALHGWTGNGIPGVMVSEEMSALSLGKRTLQHLTNLPEEHWRERADDVEIDIAAYQGTHSPCYVVESCGTADAAASAIERHVRENGSRVAVVDYAQLLSSPGKSRYEQITNTSIILRQVATSLKIVLLVLCQLNRSIETRNGAFLPVMSDLKDSGQLEQDADVIVFLCWPYRIDSSEPKEKYQFHIGKNRNRASQELIVNARFLPHRQMFLDPLPDVFQETIPQ